MVSETYVPLSQSMLPYQKSPCASRKIKTIELCEWMAGETDESRLPEKASAPATNAPHTSYFQASITRDHSLQILRTAPVCRALASLQRQSAVRDALSR